MNQEDKKILKEIKNNIPNEKKWDIFTRLILLIFVISLYSSMKSWLKIDFTLLLFLLCLTTGIYYLKDKKHWSKFYQKNSKNETIKPWWIDWTADSFKILTLVFLIRGFIGEPFQVPTGSMIPTIMINDFLLTSKMSYSVKIPVINKEIYKIADVQRGDIVVFRYPTDNLTPYVKRFIGVPGDTIVYNNLTKELKINGQMLNHQFEKDITFQDPNDYSVRDFKQYQEDFFGKKHSIWVDLKQTVLPVDKNLSPDFVKKENCTHTPEIVSCTVPKRHYFAIGDDRDNSWDSRFWGFIPEENIVGKPIILFSPSRNYSFTKLQ